MEYLFPEPISKLPKADIPIKGLEAYLSQGENHQILYMNFNEDFDLAEHTHEEQWGVVLEGKIVLTIDGVEATFEKGDRYFIPKGAKHYGKIYSGYADILYFSQRDRYKVKVD